MAQIVISKFSHLIFPLLFRYMYILFFFDFFFFVSFPGNFPFSYFITIFHSGRYISVYVHTGNISCTCVGLSLRSLYVYCMYKFFLL